MKQTIAIILDFTIDFELQKELGIPKSIYSDEKMYYRTFRGYLNSTVAGLFVKRVKIPSCIKSQQRFTLLDKSDYEFFKEVIFKNFTVEENHYKMFLVLDEDGTIINYSI